MGLGIGLGLKIGKGGKVGADYVPSISPTVGADTTADGDMEAAGVASWPASGSPTTREKSGTQAHGGSQSLRIVTDEGAEGAQQIRGATATNQWVEWGAWGYLQTGELNITGSFGIAAAKFITSTGSWQQFLATDLVTGTNPRMIFRSYNIAASEFFVDDVHFKAITLATCFDNPKTGAAVTNVGANVSVVDRTKAGVVANLDSISNPQNYVLAVIDQAKAWLYQVSAGVYTAKINGTNITYVADAVLEIRHTAETTYQLWYNGSQVGTDQTISDANINANTLYAQFSTYSGNAFTSFTL